MVWAEMAAAYSFKAPVSAYSQYGSSGAYAAPHGLCTLGLGPVMTFNSGLPRALKMMACCGIVYPECRYESRPCIHDACRN